MFVVFVSVFVGLSCPLLWDVSPIFLPITDLKSLHYIYFLSFLLKLVKSGLKEHLIFANKSQSHYHLHLLAKLYFQKHYKNVKRLTKMCQSGVRFICRDGSIPESETSVVSCAHS